MTKLHFDFRDIFRAGRYGFSGKKITVHFLGLVFVYLIYEILVYLSLLISGGSAASDFWNRYALLPVCPFVDYNLPPLTIGAMGVGTLILFVVFFLTSTMVSKITIQQLRGDNFFSMRESAGFAKKHWKAVFGIFVSLIVIFVLLALTPIVVGLLGKIPAVGHILVMLASILTILAFFLGLLMVYLLVILKVSLFFAPSVVAAVDSDTFETVYQHFSMVWNQPWRLVVYETLLFGVKLICVPIWAVFCFAGFVLAMLPIGWLIPTDMQVIMGHANQWLGGWIQKLVALLPVSQFLVLDWTEPANSPITLKIASIFMTLSLLFIAGLVIAYLLSIASVGNTLIYTIVRKRIDGENLLEVEEEEKDNISEPVAPEQTLSQEESTGEKPPSSSEEKPE